MHGVPAIAASLAEDGARPELRVRRRGSAGRRAPREAVRPAAQHVPQREHPRHARRAATRATASRRRPCSRAARNGSPRRSIPPAARSTGIVYKEGGTGPEGTDIWAVNERLRVGDADEARRDRSVADRRAARDLQVDSDAACRQETRRCDGAHCPCVVATVLGQAGAAQAQSADRARTSSSSSPTTWATATSAATARPTSRRRTSTAWRRTARG